MAQRLGRYTLKLERCPVILGSGTIGGKKESEGPLASYFDLLEEDTTFGEASWEKAESYLQKNAVAKALEHSGMSAADMDYVFAGDLLNQCISSTFGLKDLDIPFIGLYGACSTMAESLAVASCFVEGGLARRCIAVTSSHFCSAERQFRFPLEYGGQRTPSAQWTATASGACVVGEGVGPCIQEVTFGKICDLGIHDVNNMGAAMAPAAADVIWTYFQDTKAKLSDFDFILTGDLGQVGSALLYQLLSEKGMDISEKHQDCGLLLFDRENQDVGAGGSGCGCAASVFCGYILDQMKRDCLHNILFLATGALLSTTSIQQGGSIPGIAHLLHISQKKPES